MVNNYRLENFLDPAVLDMITEVRIHRPAVIEAEAPNDPVHRQLPAVGSSHSDQCV